MKIKNKMLAVGFAAVAMLAIAARWSDYPFVTSPAGSETLLVGDNATNHQWAVSNMYTLTRSNAIRGMQAGSANLTNWSALDPSTKEDQSANLDLWSALSPSSKQNASGNLDLWASVVPSSYQPILGYVPATTNFASLSVPGLILPDGTTLVIDPTTHKLSAVSGGSGTLTGPGSITAGHIATWSTLTGLADSGHALSEYALAGLTNGWPWQALNQPLTANGTAWSLLATSAKQDASANLSLWSSFTPVNYTNNLYSLFQPALGFTPLTFQQTSNLILTLTIPLDIFATNAQVTLFGVDTSTNPVPIFLGNNLSFTPTGAGYTLNTTGSGGTASALPSTNLWPASSNLVLIDLALSKDWEVGVITNNPYRFTNIYSLTNLPRTALINFHGSTNGTFAPTIIDIAGGGIMKSNSSSWFPTNASAEATLEVALDWTKTNLVTQWRTNFGPTTASTNTSTGPSGGGGGGATSYANPGGTGNRTSILTIGGTIISGTASGLVNGAFNDASAFITGVTVDSSKTITITCNSGHAFYFDEIKFYEDSTTAQGVWHLRYSDDGSSWTGIGSDFTFQGSVAGTVNTDAAWSGASAHRYWQMVGVSGTSNGGPFSQEFEFKCSTGL